MPETPHWANETADECGYQLVMFESGGTSAEDIALNRREYVALKHNLAAMRDYTVQAAAKRTALTEALESGLQKFIAIADEPMMVILLHLLSEVHDRENIASFVDLLQITWGRFRHEFVAEKEAALEAENEILREERENGRGGDPWIRSRTDSGAGTLDNRILCKRRTGKPVTGPQ